MKKILWFIFSLTVVGSLIAGCMPYYIDPVQLPTTLEDPVIAVGPDGNSHIAGISEDRVHYMRLNQSGDIKRTEILDIKWLGITQSKPDIAVTNDGTAWIVWHEKWGSQTEACYTSIPMSGSFDPVCQELIDHTTDLVRVVAHANVVYAIYVKRSFITTDKIHKVFYKNLGTGETGTVYEYVHPEEGTLYGLEIAIDSDGYLHVVYIDQGSETGDPRLRYRSNAMTEDSTMTQKWDIYETENLRTDVDPQISFHYFTSGVESVIMASAFKPGTHLKVQKCDAHLCGSKLYYSVPDTQDMDITDVDILGYQDPSGFAVSFIGKEPSEIHPQVYGWMSNATDLTQVTTSGTNKSNLSMVYGFIPVIGFIDYIIKSEPPLYIPFETTKIREYDGDSGLRTIFETVGLKDDSRKLEMAANLNLPEGTVPVSGVWYICGETWFSTNVLSYKYFLPIIQR